MSLLVHLLCASLLSHFIGEEGGLLRPREGKGLVQAHTAQAGLKITALQESLHFNALAYHLLKKMKPQVSSQILSLSLISLQHFFFFLMKAVKLLDSS